MEIAHPAEWELAVASAPDRPGECIFADRHYQRLAVRWERVKYKPRIELMVQKFRRKLDKSTDRELVMLDDLPAPWQGVLLDTADGHLVQVMASFPELQWMVEVKIVWPGRRDVTLERDILANTAPAPQDDPNVTWRAMGFDVTLDRKFQLVKNTPQVGRIHWEFDADEKPFGPLIIEKLSLAGGWLTEPLSTWLPQSLPMGGRVLNQRQITVNGHSAQEMFSQIPISRLASWVGLWRTRIDVAWQCPLEDRLYRISASMRSRGHDFELPPSLAVRCCQPSQTIVDRGQLDKKHRRKRARSKNIRRSTDVFLQAVPYINQDMGLTRNSDGTASASVPIAKPRYLVPPISWILPFGPDRKVDLDSIGLSVLDLCDARRSVEKIIEIFAADNKLTFREAQLPVTRFLRQLTQRGIIAIVGKNKD